MKILLETKDYKEIDIELPFFAYYQGDDKEIFVKIDENYFKQITMHISGSIELSKFKTPKTLALFWHQNKCNCSMWKEALKSVKLYLKNF